MSLAIEIDNAADGININHKNIIEPAVEFTENAQKRLTRLLRTKGSPSAVIRVGVRGGGCSGLSYVLKPDDEFDEDDLFWTLPNGLNIVIDPRSLKYLAGTKIDYDIKNLMEGGFKYNNPNSVKSCGCGTSFTPK